jgi:flagella basal body P-ring formation protein FlgA
MTGRFLLTIVLLASSAFASAQPPLPAQGAGDAAGLEPARAAMVAAVAERLGRNSIVTIEIEQTPVAIPEQVLATPAPGARLGEPIRFTLSGTNGRRVSVVARVNATVEHVIAARPIARDVAIVREDVELRAAPLVGVLLEPLPGLEDVLAARTRRSFAAGEVFSRSGLTRPFAVRAGDTVSMTVRTGSIEAKGIGRAVSSGFVGDVIRVLRPGAREPYRARIVAPAAVELLR